MQPEVIEVPTLQMCAVLFVVSNVDGTPAPGPVRVEQIDELRVADTGIVIVPGARDVRLTGGIQVEPFWVPARYRVTIPGEAPRVVLTPAVELLPYHELPTVEGETI